MKYGTDPSIEPAEVQKGLVLFLIEEAPDKEARPNLFILEWLINSLTAIPQRSAKSIANIHHISGMFSIKFLGPKIFPVIFFPEVCCLC